MLSTYDPWSQVQSYARLDAKEVSGAEIDRSVETIRRNVHSTSAKVARACDGFVRHCAAVRASGAADEGDPRALLLWIEAASRTVADARCGLVQGEVTVASATSLAVSPPSSAIPRSLASGRVEHHGVRVDHVDCVRFA